MTTLLLLRLDETDDATRPRDAIGNLGDLNEDVGLEMPGIVDAALGRGRQFFADVANGLQAQDIVPGSTLLTRDASIQVMLSWDLATQESVSDIGTIYARGKGTAAAEYVGAGLELNVVNAPGNVGQLRWLWHDVAGALKTQVGAHFKPTTDGSFMLLTATRRWVSSGEVVLRYYLGDRLLGEYTSVDGSIGGGTTGTTSIGTRFQGGAWNVFLEGVIDELRVVDYELSPEEIAATWKRITLHQPNGYRLLLELHDPGFPISKDPGSRVQLETRMWGHALGFATAQAENLRNILPTRAYGTPLEDWETVLKQAPKPGDSVDTRRARVVARERRAADGSGISIPGLNAALLELVDTDPANLEILAFDQTITDAFTTLDTLRWTPNPAAAWTIAGGELKVVGANGEDLRFDGTLQGWKTNAMSIGGDGTGAHILTRIEPTDLGGDNNNDTEAGIFLADFAAGNVLLLGLRRTDGDGGLVKVWTEAFRSWVSQGETMRANLGVAPAQAWLHLYHAGAAGFGGGSDLGDFIAQWSTTSGTAGFASAPAINHKRKTYWAGHYLRSVGNALDDDAEIHFDDTIVRAPLGERSFFLYVYRNPALPGRPDLVGANHVLKQLKQAHTHAAVITNKSLLCDDPTTPCDLGPLGGI